MGWKNWPYWLRGGIIGLVIGILAVIFLYISLVSCLDEETKNVICKAPIYMGVLFFPLYLLNYLRDLLQFYIGWALVELIFLPIFYMVIGALIGFIYGKIKNRNKQNKE